MNNQIDYKIAGVHFDYKNGQKMWDLMKRGFVNSVQKNTNAKFDLRILPPPKVNKRKTKNKFVTNNYKLKEWRDIVYQSDRPVVLMDTDMIVLDNIDEAFSENITLTERGHKWFNGGVVFVTPNERTKKFFDAWVEMDEQMFKDPNLRKRETKKHTVLGLNQTALRTIYDEWADLFSWVSCQHYNACGENYWGDFNSHTKVVHVKSSLQKAVYKAHYNKKKRKKYSLLMETLLPYYQKD